MDIFTRLNCLQVRSTPVLCRIVLQEPDDEIIKSGVSPDNIRFDIGAALPVFLLDHQQKIPTLKSCLSIMIMNVFFFRKWKVLQSVQDRNETLFYRSFNIECIYCFIIIHTYILQLILNE